MSPEQAAVLLRRRAALPANSSLPLHGAGEGCGAPCSSYLALSKPGRREPGASSRRPRARDGSGTCQHSGVSIPSVNPVAAGKALPGSGAECFRATDRSALNAEPQPLGSATGTSTNSDWTAAAFEGGGRQQRRTGQSPVSALSSEAGTRRQRKTWPVASPALAPQPCTVTSVRFGRAKTTGCSEPPQKPQLGSGPGGGGPAPLPAAASAPRGLSFAPSAPPRPRCRVRSWKRGRGPRGRPRETHKA